MYAYTSSAFWCTPDGKDGLRHCDNRFATVGAYGIRVIDVGRDCKAYYCYQLRAHALGPPDLGSYLEKLVEERYVVGPLVESGVEETQHLVNAGGVAFVVFVLALRFV